MPTVLLSIVGLFSAFAYIISCMLLVSGTDHRTDDQLNKQAVFTSVGGAICVAGSLHFISGWTFGYLVFATVPIILRILRYQKDHHYIAGRERGSKGWVRAALEGVKVSAVSTFLLFLFGVLVSLNLNPPRISTPIRDDTPVDEYSDFREMVAAMSEARNASETTPHASIAIKGKIMIWDTTTGEPSGAYALIPHEKRADAGSRESTWFFVRETGREVVGTLRVGSRSKGSPLHRITVELIAVQWPQKTPLGRHVIVGDMPNNTLTLFPQFSGDVTAPISKLATDRLRIRGEFAWPEVFLFTHSTPFEVPQAYQSVEPG